MQQILTASISEQAACIRKKEVSPVELVRASLNRIDEFDSTLRAWISVNANDALAQARQAEAEIMAGHYRGPLHGLPYGVKDQIHALGFPTTLGSKVLDESEQRPPYDATVIQKLREAGAILLGKQNLHEFGKGGTLEFPWGQPRNPWNPQYSASSSSSGSGIAPVAGMCSFSIGEDTGGSVRGPAAFNGLVGLRPTFGRVSRHGAVMAGYTTDVLGPLARRVGDIAHVLHAIAGHDPQDSLSSERKSECFLPAPLSDLKGIRIGIVQEIADNDNNSEDVSAAFNRAVGQLQQAGAHITEVSLPLTMYAVPLMLLSVDADVAAWFLSKYLRDRYRRFDKGTRTRMAAASIIPATVYNRAMRGRHLVRQQMLSAFDDVDLLICPTVPTAAKPIEQMQERLDTGDEAVTRLMQRRIGVYPFSLANLPALSLPMGFSAQGLPLALQLAGRPFDERTILEVADVYERISGWHQFLPNLEETVGQVPSHQT